MFSVGVDWIPLKQEVLVELLDEGKSKLHQSNEESVVVMVPEYGNLVLFRTGVRWGGPHGEYFDYRLRIDGTEVLMSRRQERSETRPHFVVDIKGHDCLLHGAVNRYDHMCFAIESLGCRIRWDKINRADLTMDVIGLAVTVLQKLFTDRHFITRFRSSDAKNDPINNRRTGIEAGKSPCRLAIYDKRFETLHRKSPEYQAAMIQRRWDGAIPDRATRIEWQLRREKLKQFGITNVMDLFDRSQAVFEKLMTKMLRLTKEPVDRVNKNQSRAETHPVWKHLINSIPAMYAGIIRDLEPIDRSKIDASMALKTGLGHFKSAFRSYGLQFSNYREMLDAIVAVLEELGNTDAGGEKYRERVLRLYTNDLVAKGLDDAA
ncbi:hypothetical protein CGZ80_14650 [Rhodopirellula sp. MGV]|nr:hypothetical protein CGZ80_14650 [Rhodopirellula sp. MGV]PNY36903.1 hypothetical protein C2E31_10615 [Rhodopirellula baltica]